MDHHHRHELQGCGSGAVDLVHTLSLVQAANGGRDYAQPAGVRGDVVRRQCAINSRPVSGRCELKDGDLLDVCGLLMKFRVDARAPGEMQ
jgi:hypothetical protein